MPQHELENMEECDCCHKEYPEMTLIDCEACSNWVCPECMWGDQICRSHYEE